MRFLTSIGVVIALLCGFYLYPLWMIDAELERLCKAEGGVKVFESVKLPADQFRPDGYPAFFREKVWGVLSQDWLMPNYRLKFSQGVVKKIFWVTLSRDSVTVERVTDSKVMGQVVIYHRSGGGVISEGDGKRCPNEGSNVDLVKAVFIQG